MTTGVRIRPMNELDIEGICRIDEKITGRYRPEVWEQRAAYYIRGPAIPKTAASCSAMRPFATASWPPTRHCALDPRIRKSGVCRWLIIF